MVGGIKMKLGMKVGLGNVHIVLDGDPAAAKRGTARQFSAHVRCGQTAGWIKMPLGREVGLGSRRHCVRWGPSSRSPKGAQPDSPQFSAYVCCGQTSGWIKMPLGREVGLGPGHIVLDGDPAPRPPKGHSPPNFRSMSIMAKP